MIRVSPRPRIFGGEPSASVRRSQEFLRTADRRGRPRGDRGESHAGTTVIWCRRRTCHHTHVTREVTTAAQDAAVADDHNVGGRPVRHFKGHRERWTWHGIEAVAAVYLGYFSRQMTVVEIIIAEKHCLSNGGHRVDCSASYVHDGRGCTKWDRRWGS